MKKLVITTFVLIALYLLFRDAEPYQRAVSAITQNFSRAWSALTTGKTGERNESA